MPNNITVTDSGGTPKVITVTVPGGIGAPGPAGPAGPGNVLTIGTVTTLAPGASATATISGVSPNQVLNLGIPTGPAGAQGTAGVTPTISSGTINTGAPGTNVIATLTGTAPNYLLNLTIPRGNTGATGSTGPANTITIGTVTTLAAGSAATATLTGTAPNQTLNLGIPAGPQGVAGSNGSASGVLPLGGTLGQVLGKKSANDYDVGWQDIGVDSTTNSRLTGVENTINAATSANTASTLVKRDSTGSATFGTVHIANNPAAADNAANKAYVDSVATNYPVVTGGTNVTVTSTTTAGKTTYVVNNTGSAGSPTYDTLPAGTTITVLKSSGGTWPARPTTRADIIVAWKGPDPSPAIVVSGTGGMLDNVDYRLVTP